MVSSIGALASLASSIGAATRPGLTARVNVDADERHPAISRHLFGKFTEHLGRNVYLGMWAQVVPNPEFVPADRWPDADRLNRRLADAERVFRLEGLANAPNDGFSPYWLPAGALDGTHRREGIQDVQRVTVGQDGGSLTTGVFPPIHRVRSLELHLKGRADTPIEVRVGIRTLDGEEVAQTSVPLTSEWAESSHRLDVGEGHHAERGAPYLLSITFPANATVELGRIRVFPADHVDGWEPEVVAYMSEARLPMLRFPGGNFVSGYHWEDGIGPLDERPALPNPAWRDQVEWNHVGTDEWLRLCERIGAEPLICLNAGDGTPEEARRWVEYCNGDASTPMGALRARNGHPEPYAVRYWEIGNELYGRWQIGHTDAEGYARRYAEFRSAMLAADPNLRLIGNGDSVEWNRALVAHNGEDVRSISVHSLPGGRIPADADPREVFLEFMAHAEGYDQFLERLAAPMREAGLVPRLAVTELQIFTNKPTLPNNATLSEALWTAGIIHACIRTDGLVELVTHSAMLNHGGGLRKERGIVYTNPVWWTTHLYGTQPGTIPMGVRVEGPTFSVRGTWLSAGEKVPYLDVAGLLSADETACAVFVVNRHPTEPIEATVRVRRFVAASSVQIVTLTDDSFMAGNHWDAPDEVVPSHSMEALHGDTLVHRFPPHSLTRLLFRNRDTTRLG